MSQFLDVSIPQSRFLRHTTRSPSLRSRSSPQSGCKISLVVTQPNRPKGRGLELAPSPVKQSALQLGLPVTQPDRIKTNDEFRAQLTALKPDAIVIVGYGRIIPQWMLDLPPLGNINLHASLLPKYRGAAPVQWAIARGETVTGVTTMRIDAGLDTGDILLQRELPIASDDTAETIAPRLAAIGAELTVETMRGLHAGSIHPRPQDHTQSTLAPILKKTNGLADFSLSATEIFNHIRGFQPWPGVYTELSRQDSADLESAASRQTSASGPPACRRRSSALRLRHPLISRTSRTPTGGQEAHVCLRFPARLPPQARRETRPLKSTSGFTLCSPVSPVVENLGRYSSSQRSSARPLLPSY